MLVYNKHLLLNTHGMNIKVRNIFFPLCPINYVSSQESSLVYRRKRTRLHKNNAAGVKLVRLKYIYDTNHPSLKTEI